MNARRDPDRLIREFLMEGQTELADPVYDTVRDRIERTRQRVVIGPWRIPDMNRFVPAGLAAAAVLAVAFVGFQLFGDTGPGAPGASVTPGASATPDPQPTATSDVTPAPSAPADGGLPVGATHVLWDRTQGGATPDLGMQVSVTIPAAGWFGDVEGGILLKNDDDAAPDGAGLIVFAQTNDLFVGSGDVYVYGDPCHWASTKPATPVTTVDEAIAALAAQPSRDATAPVDVSYDGYAGKYITLHVPDDAVFSDCDEGEFRSFVEGEDSPRVHQGPGQIDLLTVLDVRGELVILDVAYYEGTPESVLDELAAIVESVTFRYLP